MEMEQEGAVTARVLERVPEEQLTWRPHERSMSLGQLALHIATTPGQIAKMVAGDAYNLDPAAFDVPQPASRAEVLQAHSDGLATAKAYLQGLSAEQAAATWRLMVGPQEIMAVPRAACIRSIMLNHWYHHRGQLSVYLRLLNIPVPAIYGVSADENPFAKANSQQA